MVIFFVNQFLTTQKRDELGKLFDEHHQSCVCVISDYSPGVGVVIQKGPHKDMCGKVSIVCEIISSL